jgi:(1->4)-alpha-D-glucan 1-alpha-D-glucosylmutase
VTVARGRVPVATYRVQFRRGFGFDDACRIVPYLHRLGISHLYASPVFAARPGSEHGYDIIDPNRLDPVLGSQQGFEALVRSLHSRDMGLVLDIVPNHLAADSSNPWWTDVLEHGRDSPYADFFDINWITEEDGTQAILLPVLAGSLEDCVREGSLRIAMEEVPGLGSGRSLGLFFRYFDQRFPIEPRGWSMVVCIGGDKPPVLPTRATLRRSRAALTEGVESRRGFKDRLERRLAELNTGDPASRALLFQSLLREGPYRLVDANLTSQQYAYRRFFDISWLVGLRVEDERVFEESHRLILDLAHKGHLDGLRIDHIDGLRDPEGYLKRLRSSLPDACYLLVEKVLAPQESLRGSWPVCGTTGYDFLNKAGGMFIDPTGLHRLDRLHARLTGDRSGFKDLAYLGKKRVLQTLFGGELRHLADRLVRLTADDGPSSGLGVHRLSEALAEITCCLSVYRTYIRDLHPCALDRASIDQAAAEAMRRNPAGLARPLGYLSRILTLDQTCAMVSAHPDEALAFALSWQQLTGPVAAKGVEDTALYRDSHLLSLDEIGGDTSVSSDAVDGFHRHCATMKESWPATLNATSTHDTKRSEDVRVRLDVLSELADVWAERLERWMTWNAGRRTPSGCDMVPDRREEILIYQTLVGAWPLQPEEIPDFGERVKRFMVKALREAKIHSDWRVPDTRYEGLVTRFVDAVLHEEGGNPFPADLRRFVQRIAWPGAVNSLAQVVAKIAAPGVPDFFQGNELWEFDLTDPDNRRPVEFTERERLLAQLDRDTAAPHAGVRDVPHLGQGDVPHLAESSGVHPAATPDLLRGWADGRLKLFVTQRALAFRRDSAALFCEGDYLPLDIDGPMTSHLVGFARRLGDRWAIAVMPRLLGGRPQNLAGPGSAPSIWARTDIVLPRESPRNWRDVLIGREMVAGTDHPEARSALPAGELFSELPVALLEGRTAYR